MKPIFAANLGLLAALLIAAPSSARIQKEVIGYWTLELTPGFNLVGFPVLPDDPTPERVIGDRLGAVELMSWDRGLDAWRRTRYDPDSRRWEGNLLLLNYGTAYWLHLPSDAGNQNLLVVGRPEEYVNFRWSQLGGGWRYYAPTFGRSQRLDDLPPDRDTRLLIAWNSLQGRFDLVVTETLLDRLSNGFDAIEPDKGYMVLNAARELRRITGAGEAVQDVVGNNGLPDGINFPPRPLVVGNLNGLPVCYDNGEACSGDFVIRVIREESRLGLGSELELIAVSLGDWRAAFAASDPGHFAIAITLGGGDDQIRRGDRIYLVLLGPNGSQTRSGSFEVGGAVTVLDIHFPDPLTVPGKRETSPTVFTLGAPHPNPFNDRFQLEFSAPKTGLMEFALYTTDGRAVRRWSNLMSAGVHRLTVPADGISAGVYLFEVKTPSGRGLVKTAYLK